MSRARRGLAVAALVPVAVAAAVTVALTTVEHPLETIVARSRGARFHGRGGGVLQHSANDCGPAALTHGLRLLGAAVPYPDPRSRVALGPGGCRFGALAEEADRHGFHATFRVADPDRVESVRTPAILWLEGEHFVVLERVAGGRAVVFDPALGRVSYSPASLRRHWRGHVMEFLQPERRPEP